MRLSCVAILLVQGACTQLADEPVAETQQNSLNFSSTLLNMGPEAYWRLDDKNGTVANDSSSNHINGNYVKPITWVAGGVTSDPDLAIATDESVNKGYVDIPDDRRLSLTRAWDDFNRAAITYGWGTSTGGDSWTPQVSTSLSYYSANGTQGVIDPHGASGTFQIGVNVTLKDGDTQVRGSWSTDAAGGTLQPITIVARRVDNYNFVRASLEELTDTTLQITISKTVAGVTTTLASKTFLDEWGLARYHPGEGYYLRFQFEGDQLKAKAWHADMIHTGVAPTCTGGCPISYESTASWLTATDSSPQTGSVSLRSSNSLGTTRPVVTFDDFWYQTVGFTVHYMAWINTLEQIGDTSINHTNDLLGKGAAHHTSDKQEEYEARFIPGNATQDPTDPTDQFICKGCLKFYAFNIDGKWGAGTEYPDLSCSAPYKCSIATEPTTGNPLVTGRWYDIVAELDSGDWLDPTAGVSMYVNGALWQSGTQHCTGNLYSGFDCETGKGPEWQIVPNSGTRSLKLMTFDTYEHWNGRLDEVAIFPRKLSAGEVATLYSSLTAP